MFGIQTPHDYFKATSENVRAFFEGVEEPSKALNAINSLNHLPEWLWKAWLRDSELARKELGTLNHADYKEWVDANVPYSKVIRALSNGAKHFDRQPTTGVSGGFGRARWGKGRWGSSVLLVNINPGPDPDASQLVPVSDVLNSSFAFWSNFFQKNNFD